MDPVTVPCHNDTHDDPSCYVCPPPPQPVTLKTTTFNYKSVIVSTATVFALTLATIIGTAILYYLYIFASYACSSIIIFIQIHSDAISITFTLIFLIAILINLDDNNKLTQSTRSHHNEDGHSFKHTTQLHNVWTYHYHKS